MPALVHLFAPVLWVQLGLALVLPVTWASSGEAEAVENQKGERRDWALKVGVSLGVSGEMTGAWSSSPASCSSPSAVMTDSWGSETDLSLVMLSSPDGSFVSSFDQLSAVKSQGSKGESNFLFLW